jgi:hypothetical protein
MSELLHRSWDATEGHLNDAQARASTLNSMVSEAVVKTAEEDQIR